MKYRVFTENGDILFYGFNSQASRTFAAWKRVSFVGSPEQHAQLAGHLNRHNSAWTFEDRRSLEEGVMVYDLPPYFKVESVEDGAPETDAAVHAVNPAITEPTFPAEHTADPYTTIIDINFVYEGERFRTEEVRGGEKYIRYGTFAMDGHAVSPNYGWLKAEEAGETRTAEAKRKANDPVMGGAPHINVHYDDRPAGYYNKSVPRNDRLKIEYVPAGAGWPNEELRVNPEDSGRVKVYGLPEVAKRKFRIQDESRSRRKRAEAERAVEKAKADLAAAERALRNLG